MPAMPKTTRTPLVVGRALAVSRVSSRQIGSIAAWARSAGSNPSDPAAAIHGYLTSDFENLVEHVHRLLLPALTVTGILPPDPAAVEAAVCEIHDAWAVAVGPLLAWQLTDNRIMSSVGATP